MAPARQQRRAGVGLVTAVASALALSLALSRCSGARALATWSDGNSSEGEDAAIVRDEARSARHRQPSPMRPKVRQSRLRSLRSVPKRSVDRIYQMLKDLTDVLEEEQVTYWIEGGTLLGAVRHKGLIPWDDDADIGVPLTEEAQLVALGARFAELGYELQQWFYGFKFYPVDGEVIPQADKTFLYPFVDVFLVDWFRGSSFYPRTNLFVERSFRSEDLFPLRECAFGPLVLKCAHNPVPYLNACYGQEGEWQTMAHRGKDHRTYANERSEVHVLQSLETFRPALPSRPLLDRARQSARGPAAASPQPHSHAPAPADV